MMLTDEQIAQLGDEYGLGTIIKDAGYKNDILWFETDLTPFARAVERALQPKWSDQPPTVPGWYWYRTQSTDEPRIIEGSRDGERMEWYLGGALMYAKLRGQWAGPITPPEE